MWISGSEHDKALDNNLYPITKRFQDEANRMKAVGIEPALVMCDPEHFYMLKKELYQFTSASVVSRRMGVPRQSFYLLVIFGISLLVHEMAEYRGIDIFGRIPDKDFDGKLPTRIKEHEL